jgi:hypothetical protein
MHFYFVTPHLGGTLTITTDNPADLEKALSALNLTPPMVVQNEPAIKSLLPNPPPPSTYVLRLQRSLLSLLVQDLGYRQTPFASRSPVRHITAWNNAIDNMSREEIEQLIRDLDAVKSEKPKPGDTVRMTSKCSANGHTVEIGDVGVIVGGFPKVDEYFVQFYGFELWINVENLTVVNQQKPHTIK